MTAMKIVLPNWVYRNLNDFGNCALPNICNDMEIPSLERHLTNKMGVKIKVRVAYMREEKTLYTPLKKSYGLTKYLIAEEKR